MHVYNPIGRWGLIRILWAVPNYSIGDLDGETDRKDMFEHSLYTKSAVSDRTVYNVSFKPSNAAPRRKYKIPEVNIHQGLQVRTD